MSEACWLFGGVLVGGILHVVWPAAACAPARGAAPEPRRRVAARRCVAGAWALRRGIVLCALTKGACGSRRAAGPAECSSSWPAAGTLTGPRARRGGRLPGLPAEALVQRRQRRAPARAHPRRAPAPGPASCPHRALRVSSRLDGDRIWRVWCEGAERGRAGRRARVRRAGSGEQTGRRRVSAAASLAQPTQGSTGVRRGSVGRARRGRSSWSSSWSASSRRARRRTMRRLWWRWPRTAATSRISRLRTSAPRPPARAAPCCAAGAQPAARRRAGSHRLHIYLCLNS